MLLKYFPHKNNRTSKGKRTPPPQIPKLSLIPHFAYISPRQGDLLLPASVRLTVRTDRDHQQYIGSQSPSEVCVKSEGRYENSVSTSTTIDAEGSLDVCGTGNFSSSACSSSTTYDTKESLGSQASDLQGVPGVSDVSSPVSSPRSHEQQHKSATESQRKDIMDSSIYKERPEEAMEIRRDLAALFTKKLKEARYAEKARNSFCDSSHDDRSVTHPIHYEGSNAPKLASTQPTRTQPDTSKSTLDVHERTSQDKSNTKRPPVVCRHPCVSFKEELCEHLEDNASKKSSIAMSSTVKSVSGDTLPAAENNKQLLMHTLRCAVRDVSYSIGSLVQDILFSEPQDFSSVGKNKETKRVCAHHASNAWLQEPLPQVERPVKRRPDSRDRVPPMNSGGRLGSNITSNVHGGLRDKSLNSRADPKDVPKFHVEKDLRRESTATRQKRTYGRESSFFEPVNQEERLLQKEYDTHYWRESEIKPIKKKMDPPSLWQRLWHTIDPATMSELKLRHQRMVQRNGHKVITRQKWNPSLKVENVPYIPQIVVETGQLRMSLPFNCRFLRLPYTGEDQVVRLWFNTPVGKSQRGCLSATPEYEDFSTEWVKDVEQDPQPKITGSNYKRFSHARDLLNNVDEDELTEAQIQDICDNIIHPKSETYRNAPVFQYTPANDFRTFFRFDIPVAVLNENPDYTIETKALLDPVGAFYDCHRENEPSENFQSLVDTATHVFREPTVKFRVKLYMQGTHSLVTTGDLGADHILRIPPCERDTNSLFRKKMDPLDHLVGGLLNSNCQNLLHKMQTEKLHRLCTGKYSIDNNEYDVKEATITPINYPGFDFSFYPHITTSMYALGFKTPLVCTEDSYQPLLDFLHDSKTNHRWIAIEKNIKPLSKYGITGVLQTVPCSLDNWSRIVIPEELDDNPDNAEKLYNHAQAIKLNLTFQGCPAIYDGISITNDFHKDLEPPILRIGKSAFSSSCRYTFAEVESTNEVPVVVPIKYHQHRKDRAFPPSFLIPYSSVQKRTMHDALQFSSMPGPPQNAAVEPRKPINRTSASHTRNIPPYTSSKNLNTVEQNCCDNHSPITSHVHQDIRKSSRPIDVSIEEEKVTDKTKHTVSRGMLSNGAPRVNKEQGVRRTHPKVPSLPLKKIWLMQEEERRGELRSHLYKDSAPLSSIPEQPSTKRHQDNHFNKDTSSVFQVPSLDNLGSQNVYTNPAFSNAPVQRGNEKTVEAYSRFALRNKEQRPPIVDLRKHPNLFNGIPALQRRQRNPSIPYCGNVPPNTTALRAQPLPQNSSVENRNMPILRSTQPPIKETREQFRNRIIEEQRINKLQYSRFTGKPLGYRASAVSALGEVIFPDEPSLPPIEVLERMTPQQRKHLKSLRTRLFSQQLLEHHQIEWFRSSTYSRIQETLKENGLER